MSLDNFSIYGLRKVWPQLKREGFNVARCTVERLRRETGMLEQSGAGDKAAPCRRDQVNRQFNPPALNRLWAANFTYVTT